METYDERERRWFKTELKSKKSQKLKGLELETITNQIEKQVKEKEPERWQIILYEIIEDMDVFAKKYLYRNEKEDMLDFYWNNTNDIIRGYLEEFNRRKEKGGPDEI